MFLIEIANGSFLLSFMPESGALLLCGISLVGGAVAARKFLKHKDAEKNSQVGKSDDLEAEK